MSLFPAKFFQNLTVPLQKFVQSSALLNQPMVWDGGQWAPGSPHFTAVATAIETRATNTHANSTQLTAPSMPPGIYRWRAVIVFQTTGAGTGIGFRINMASGAADLSTGSWAISQGINGTDRYFEYDDINFTVNLTTTNTPAANADQIATGEGYINVTTAGQGTVQFRSENTGTVSIRPNSVVIFSRVL